MNLKFRPRFVLTFAWFYGWSSVKRGPGWVLSYLAWPLAILFMMYMVSRGSLVDYALLGGVISTVTSNALSSLGDTAFLKLEIKLQDLLVSAGVSPLEYIVGIGIGNLVYSFPGLALFVILLAAYRVVSTPLQWGVMAVALLMLVIGASGLAYMGGSRLTHVRNSWGLAAFLSIFLTMIPPTYYPYTFLPRPALLVLLVSPATPAAVLLQKLVFDGSLDLPMLGLLIFENLIYAALGMSLGRWED
ncbi:MAG: ABC transporter permease [Acidilobus sp.]